MSKLVVISQRKLKSYQRAETFCRVIRFLIARPGNHRWPVTPEEMPVFVALFQQWMDTTGNIKYELPAEWP